MKRTRCNEKEECVNVELELILYNRSVLCPMHKRTGKEQWSNLQFKRREVASLEEALLFVDLRLAR